MSKSFMMCLLVMLVAERLWAVYERMSPNDVQVANVRTRYVLLCLVALARSIINRGTVGSAGSVH